MHDKSVDGDRSDMPGPRTREYEEELARAECLACGFCESASDYSELGSRRERSGDGPRGVICVLGRIRGQGLVRLGLFYSFLFYSFFLFIFKSRIYIQILCPIYPQIIL